MSKTNTLDITPSSDLILALHRQRLGWFQCFGELIDNSFDAAATSIRIEFRKNSLLVSDDGKGCDDLRAMLRLGDHSRHASTELGRYGVGLKDAALWLGGETRLASVKGGILRVASADWEAIRKSGRWSVDEHELEPTPEDCQEYGLHDKHGTSIRFQRIAKRTCNIQSIVGELGYTFAPAIKSGRSIVIIHGGKSLPIPAFEIPPLENIIDVESECNGKSFRVRAGVVPEQGANPRPGFTISYRHRVITRTSDGCGEFGTARFFGWVELGDGWKLSKNKDELVEDAETLADRLLQICRSQLSAASQQAMDIDIAGIESAIQAELQRGLQSTSKRKEKRDAPVNETGRVEPKATDRQRRTATKTQLGDNRLTGCIGGSIKVHFVNTQDKRIGWAETNQQGILIFLCQSHPLVNRLRSEKESLALAILAGGILANHAACSESEKVKQKYLPEVEADGFEATYLQAMALYTSHMGTPAVTKSGAAA